MGWFTRKSADTTNNAVAENTNQTQQPVSEDEAQEFSSYESYSGEEDEEDSSFEAAPLARRNTPFRKRALRAVVNQTREFGQYMQEISRDCNDCGRESAKGFLTEIKDEFSKLEELTKQGVSTVTGSTVKPLGNALDKVDQNILSKAWLQLLTIMIMVVMYVIDIFLDLWFAFVDVRRQYVKFEIDEINSTYSHMNPPQYLNQTEIEQTPEYKGLFFLGLFPTQDNCYSAIFWASLAVIIMAYVMYSMATLYIIFGTNLKSFEEFRDNIKNNRSHKIRFALFTLLGIGPNYFIWEDLKSEWKLLGDNLTFKEKLQQKTLVWLDVYIHTLHLIHTSFEDIPLLYLYVYIAIHETQYFIKESLFFYPTIISSIFFFCQDYSFWMNAVTTPRKTDGEGWAVIFWTVGYLLLHLAAIGPTILAFDIVFRGKIWKSDRYKARTGDMTIYQAKGCGAERMIKIFGDDDFAPGAGTVMLVVAFLLPLIIRLVGAVAMALINTYKAAKESLKAKPVEITQVANKPTEVTTRTVKLTWDLFYGALRYVGVYLGGAPIYSVIPFAGGKRRTLANSFIFTAQYTIIFGVLMFNFCPEIILYLSEALSDHRDAANPFNSDDTPPVPVFARVVCGLLIAITWTLQGVTLHWYFHEHRSQFLQNFVDYLDRSKAPYYYQKDDRYRKHNRQDIQIGRTKTKYIERLDGFDPLTKMERRDLAKIKEAENLKKTNFMIRKQVEAIRRINSVRLTSIRKRSSKRAHDEQANDESDEGMRLTAKEILSVQRKESRRYQNTQFLGVPGQEKPDFSDVPKTYV